MFQAMGKLGNLLLFLPQTYFAQHNCSTYKQLVVHCCNNERKRKKLCVCVGLSGDAAA